MNDTRTYRLLRLVAAVVLALAGPVTAGLMAAPAQAETLEVGFRDHNYSTSVTAPTGQKPQSKLWFSDGHWWGVLWDTPARRFAIHRFNLDTQATEAWTSTGVAVDARRNSQTDALWDASSQQLYVLVHLKDTDTTTADQSMKVLRYGYSAGTYTLESSQTLAQQKVESAVLDRDSLGRLWVSYTAPTTGGLGEVKVAHTTTSDTDWTAPSTLPVPGGAATVDADDLSTVVAYGDRGARRIGVLWSNELHSALYFAGHADGAPDDSWELTTLCSTTQCGDDHLNIKSIDADASGNLFAVIKTSLNDASSPDPDDPLIVVYRLNPDGTWSSSVAWTVGEGDMTRAIVVLDSQNRQVHTFAAGPCCSGGTVYTKNASFSALDFPRGLGSPFIRSATVGENVNNPTSTKQTVNGSTGLLVLAGIDSTRDYVHNYLPLADGDTTAPEVVDVTPADGSTAATSTDVTAVFSEAVEPTSVTGSTFELHDATGLSVPAAVGYDPLTRQATLDPVDDLAPVSGYTATVRGGDDGVRDLAGNPLALDTSWGFTTSEAEPPTETVTVPLLEDTYVSDAAPSTSFGAAPDLWVDKKPVRVAYLKFDLSPYAGRALTAATLRLRVADNASTGAQSVKLVDDDSWTELGTTYANRPPLGVALGGFGPTKPVTDYRVTLDPAVVGPEVGDWFSVGIDSPSSDGLQLASGETETPPTLELVLGPAVPDTTAPTVTGVSPVDGASDVHVAVSVSATFSERMDPATVTTTTVALLGPGDSAVPAAVEYSTVTRTVTLDPVDPLAADTTYTALVTGGPGGVTDLAGNPLATDHSWTFTTAPPPAETVTLTPVADAYVSGKSPTVNYGAAVLLSVDSQPVETAYLKFDLGALADRTVVEARLELTTTTSGSKGLQTVRLVADDGWAEQLITYDAAPPLGPGVGTLGPTLPRKAYAVPLDVRALDGEPGELLTLGLDTTSTDGVVLASRETSRPPRLVLLLAAKG